MNCGVISSARRRTPHDPHWADVLFQQVFSAGVSDQSSFSRTVTNTGLSTSGDQLILDGTHVLTVPDSNDWNFAGDFCLDLWGVNFTSIAADNVVISHNDASVSQRSWLLEFAVSNTTIAGGLSTNGTSSTFVQNTGFHISAATDYDIRMERTGTDVRLFVGGNMKAKITFSGTLFDRGDTMVIGSTKASGTLVSKMTGRLKAVRITNASRWGSDSDYTIETLPLLTS